jgi:hypothetical protein
MAKKVSISRLTYIKYALFHPWHVVVLAGASIFGVANWSVLVMFLIFVAMELVLLAIVMILPAFRTYVKEYEEGKARGKAAEARAALLVQLRDEDRREYLRLEARLTGLETRLANFPAISSVVNEECKDLLKEFLQLSIQIALATASANDDWSLGYKICDLTNARKTNSNPLIEQRLDRLDRHRVWSDENKKTLQDITHHQSAISDTINMIIDRTVMPVVDTKYRVISKLGGDITSGGDMMSEMTDFVQIEDIDMDEFLEGRAR